MKLSKHRAELRCDALRQEYRDACADPQELDMRNSPQLAEQMLELVVAKKQRVAAAEQHVADGGCAANIIELAGEFRMEIVAAGVANEPRARAVTAIGGT